MYTCMYEVLCDHEQRHVWMDDKLIDVAIEVTMYIPNSKQMQ